MKNLAVLFLFLVVGTLSAQTDSLTSPAKSSITLFWKQITKMKAADPASFSFRSAADLAETQLKNVKKQDPAYNTATMQRALDDQKARMPVAASQPAEGENSPQETRVASEGGQSNSGQAARALQRDIENMHDSLFVRIPFQGPIRTAADESRADEERNSYLQTAERYKAKGISPEERDMKDMLRKNGVDTTGLSAEINGDVRTLKTSTEDFAIGSYYHLLALQAYWYAASSIYHNRSDFKAAHDKVSQTIKDLGGLDKVKAQLATNLSNRGSDVQMPASRQQNASLEQEFKTAFEREGWNETILKVNILTTDWDVLRNKNTGVIVGRTQTAAIAAKNKNGECLLYTYTIIQEYDGSKYLSAKRYSHDTKYIACGNVK